MFDTAIRGRSAAASPLLAATGIVLLIIACASLVPFNFDTSLGGRTDGYGIGRIAWVPSPTYDIIQNIVAYAPVGLLVTLLITRAGMRFPLAAALGTAFGLSVSVSMEWLQTMMSMRCASWTDVCINTLGAAMGSTLVASRPLWDAGHTRLANAMAYRPFAIAAKALTVGLLAYHLVPFDFVTSSDALHRSLAQTRLSLGVPYGFDHQQTTLAWLDWIGYAGQFAMLGFLLVRARSIRNQSVHAAVDTLSYAVGSVAIVALAIEILQVFVASHAPELMDWLFAVAGGAVGATISTGLCAIGFRLPLRRCIGLFAFGQVVFLVAADALPYDLSWSTFDLHRVVWLPMSGLAGRPVFAAMSEMASQSASCILIGLAAWTLFKSLGRSRCLAAAALLTVAVAGACEFIQLLTPQRYPDVTHPMLAGVIAIGVAWTAFELARWRDLAAARAKQIAWTSTRRTFR